MWDVKILRVNRIEPIPDADKIELVYVGDWSVVSQKGLWKVGDLAAYIPCDSLLPATLVESLGLVGKLSGVGKNRVKPIRLKGQLSIGLLAPAPTGTSEGDSVAEQLGITKYEQFIPVHLAGKVRSHPEGWSKYDIDNIRSDNHFIDGEEIVISSKLHGSNVSFALINNEFFVSSKNCTLEKDIENIYWKIAIEYDIENKMRAIFTDPRCPVWVYGEVFGGNIQKDFNYGLVKPELRLFDIKYNNAWLDFDSFISKSKELDLSTVPMLYRGPYSKELVFQWSNDHTKHFPDQTHINEGVVVKPVFERRTRRGERVISKCISESYLMRKDGTEYN